MRIPVPVVNFALKDELTPLGIELTRRLLGDVDRDVAGLIADGHTIGWDVACKPGCAACCTFLVGSTIQEAYLAAVAVQRLPQAARQGIIARLAAWERTWILAHGNVKLLEEPVAAMRWQVRRIPCPMLDPTDYTCLVYDDRPIGCRTHHACAWPADAPPRACCAVETPGDGCFNVQANVDHGHNADVWQLDVTLLLKWTEQLQELIASRADAGYPEAGILPLQVLRIGRERFGWKSPAKLVTLPMMRHSTPPRRGR
jgi:Fe-S-cluster containining protein